MFQSILGLVLAGGIVCVARSAYIVKQINSMNTDEADGAKNASDLMLIATIYFLLALILFIAFTAAIISLLVQR